MRAKRWRVYVVELCDAEELGARVNPRLPHVYVGVTVLLPESRFATHKAGGQTASGTVAKYGIRLMPELYASVPRVATDEEARALEDAFAERLKGEGYTVHHGSGFFWDQYR